MPSAQGIQRRRQEFRGREEPRSLGEFVLAPVVEHLEK